LAAVGFAGAGHGWVLLLERLVPQLETMSIGLLRSELGLGLALFVLAILPGVFEEIAFRGLIQGRLSRLLGVGAGIVVSGAAFGLAHGVTLALPLHVGLGFYLGWLRVRSQSLLPGMVLHIVYNGVWVLAGG
jgi:membrane protease YdiL (CAAX protease family)